MIFLCLCLLRRLYQSVFLWFKSMDGFILLLAEVNMSVSEVSVWHIGFHDHQNPMESSIANSNLARLLDSNLIQGLSEVSHWMECSARLNVSWSQASCERHAQGCQVMNWRERERSHEADVLPVARDPLLKKCSSESCQSDTKILPFTVFRRRACQRKNLMSGKAEYELCSSLKRCFVDNCILGVSFQ